MRDLAFILSLAAVLGLALHRQAWAGDCCCAPDHVLQITADHQGPEAEHACCTRQSPTPPAEDDDPHPCSCETCPASSCNTSPAKSLIGVVGAPDISLSGDARHISWAGGADIPQSSTIGGLLRPPRA